MTQEKHTSSAGARNAQHTAGPWEISRDAVPVGFSQNTIYAETDGARVATAFLNEANASLIAAAPELLTACEALEKRLTAAARALYVDGNSKAIKAALDGWKADIEPARAAIARATQTL